MNEAGIRQVLEYLGVFQPGRSYRQGDFFIHPCPFASVLHSGGKDNNPSFGIAIRRDDSSYYNCFSCKQKGSLVFLPDHLARIVKGDLGGDSEGINFVRNLENESKKESVGTKPVIVRQFEKVEPLNMAVYENMYDSVFDHPQAMEYVRGRGISDEALEYARIMYDPKECRIIFPVYGVDQQLYGFSGRTVLENWKDYHQPPVRFYPRIKNYFHFPNRHFVLGEDRIVKGKPTVVVEGLFGYLNLITQGAHNLVNVVALLGSSITPEKADKLIRSGTAIYLLLDNDEAGEIGIFGNKRHKGALDYLRPFCSVYIPEWPENKTDPDQLVLQDIEYMLQFTCPYIGDSNYSSGKSFLGNSNGSVASGKGK